MTDHMDGEGRKESGDVAVDDWVDVADVVDVPEVDDGWVDAVDGADELEFDDVGSDDAPEIDDDWPNATDATDVLEFDEDWFDVADAAGVPAFDEMFKVVDVSGSGDGVLAAVDVAEPPVGELVKGGVDVGVAAPGEGLP